MNDMDFPFPTRGTQSRAGDYLARGIAVVKASELADLQRTPD
jgi:hypothetical protein